MIGGGLFLILAASWWRAFAITAPETMAHRA